jgi:hypothetical protein
MTRSKHGRDASARLPGPASGSQPTRMSAGPRAGRPHRGPSLSISLRALSRDTRFEEAGVSPCPSPPPTPPPPSPPHPPPSPAPCSRPHHSGPFRAVPSRAEQRPDSHHPARDTGRLSDRGAGRAGPEPGRHSQVGSARPAGPASMPQGLGRPVPAGSPWGKKCPGASAAADRPAGRPAAATGRAGPPRTGIQGGGRRRRLRVVARAAAAARLSPPWRPCGRHCEREGVCVYVR